MEPSLAIALGVALPESKRIELLPTKQPIWSRVQMETFIPKLSAFLTLLVFLGIVWNMSGQVSTLKKERDEKIAKVKETEMLQAKLTLLKEKENQIRQNLSVLPSSIVARSPFRRALREIAHMMPSNATFTLLSIQSKAKPSEAEPQTNRENELQMKGLVFGSDSDCLTALARMIGGLEKSPLFKSAKLVSADEITSYDQPGIRFEIVCDIELDHPFSPPFHKGRPGD